VFSFAAVVIIDFDKTDQFILVKSNFEFFFCLIAILTPNFHKVVILTFKKKKLQNGLLGFASVIVLKSIF